MEKLRWPSLFCNSLVIDRDGMIADYTLRQKDGKRKAVKALQGIGFTVFAAGDSYNDLTMIKSADRGALFRAPQRIIDEEPQLPHAVTYDEFSAIIDDFLGIRG
jgi:phosphoserine/homoserine phosphotransferase